jgi:hypothetical protein
MNGLPSLLRCIAIVLLMTDMALAEPIRDERSDVVINPPQGWRLERVFDIGHFYRLYPILTETDLDNAKLAAKAEAHKLAQCTLAASSEEGQTERNVPFREPAYLDRAKADMEQYADVVSADRFIKGPVIRVTVIGDPRADPDRRLISVVLTTPGSIANLACGAQRVQFEARREQFDAIVRGITLPE